MQIEWGRLSRTWGRPIAGLTAVAVVLVAFVSSGCQRWSEAEASPVAIGVPPEVTDKVDNAQAAYINSLRTIATDYDAVVCQEERNIAQRQDDRQALAEAHLEVAQAVGNAKRALPNQGGGPTAEEQYEGITIIEETPKPTRNRGGWKCLDVSSEPSCVAATSSGVAREVFRNHIDGYDLNPVTMGDVLEAFAADAAWADQYLVGASTQGEAYDKIQAACRAGQSPLARFFRAGVDFEHREVRRDILMLRDDFVGVQGNVCEALPIYYENVLTELRNDLSARVRTNRCSVPQWEALWEEASTN